MGNFDWYIRIQEKENGDDVWIWVDYSVKVHHLCISPYIFNVSVVHVEGLYCPISFLLKILWRPGEIFVMLSISRRNLTSLSISPEFSNT
jgi:hypothetical protein